MLAFSSHSTELNWADDDEWWDEDKQVRADFKPSGQSLDSNRPNTLKAIKKFRKTSFKRTENPKMADRDYPFIRSVAKKHQQILEFIFCAAMKLLLVVVVEIRIQIDICSAFRLFENISNYFINY